MKNKLILLILITALIGGGFSFPSKTSAVLAVPANVDTFSSPMTALSTIATDATTVEDLLQDLLEWAAKLLDEKLRRELLDMLVDQMLDFINDGDGLIIQDWKEFLNEAAEEASESFANQVAATSMCPGFSNIISDSLGATGATGGGISSLECSLTAYPAGTGGWDGFLERTRPENSFIHVYLATKNAQSKAAQEAEEAAELEGVVGGGFISDKVDELITTPGSVIKDLASKAVGSEIDYVLNAEDLESFVSAVASAIFSDVLNDGLALVSAKKDRTTSYASTISNNLTGYVDTTSLGEVSNSQFSKEKELTLDQVKEAIDLRRSGQSLYSTMASLNNSNFTPAVAETALSALEYLQTELYVLDSSSDLRSCGDSRFSSISKIQTQIIPLIDDSVREVKAAREALYLGDDDFPLLNPDNTPEDNLDIIAFLEQAEIDLNALTSNTESARTELIQIRAAVGSDVVIRAREFKNGVENAKRYLLRAFDLLTEDDDFARDLDNCTKHRATAGTHIGGTLPFSYPPDSWTTIPSRPFPWEP